MKAAQYNVVFRVCRRNAGQRGIPFELTLTDFMALIERSGGRCEVSGIPFSDEKVGSATRRPYMVSIDRIDATQGYTVENVRLVCCIVNYAMMDWGEQPLRYLVQMMSNEQQGPRPPLMVAQMRAGKRANSLEDWLTLKEYKERVGITQPAHMWTARVSANARRILAQHGEKPRKKSHVMYVTVEGVTAYREALSYPASVLAEVCKGLA